MSKLQLSIAVGNYDRMRPLIDGEVQIDGVDPVFMLQDPEEIFFRAFRHADYDICELSLSSYSVKTAAGTSPYIAVPVFPSRAFRHSSVYVRADRGINRPEDLKGKRIGVPEYQLTANVWVRMFLEEEYGVKASDIRWVRGGYEDPTREEKIALKLPEGAALENAPEGRTISNLLAEGEIDGVIGPRAPSCFERGHPQVKYLFDDPQKAAAAIIKLVDSAQPPSHLLLGTDALAYVRNKLDFLQQEIQQWEHVTTSTNFENEGVA